MIDALRPPTSWPVMAKQPLALAAPGPAATGAAGDAGPSCSSEASHGGCDQAATTDQRPAAAPAAVALAALAAAAAAASAEPSSSPEKSDTETMAPEEGSEPRGEAAGAAAGAQAAADDLQQQQQQPVGWHSDWSRYSDHFMMVGFKILPCRKRTHHDWTGCPFSHHDEKARRRCSKHAFVAMCPDINKASGCPRGTRCHMAHSAFEFWLHPERFKTELCKFGTKCTRKVCFFAHHPDELRTPTQMPLAADEVLPSGVQQQQQLQQQQQQHCDGRDSHDGRGGAHVPVQVELPSSAAASDGDSSQLSPECRQPSSDVATSAAQDLIKRSLSTSAIADLRARQVSASSDHNTSSAANASGTVGMLNPGGAGQQQLHMQQQLFTLQQQHQHQQGHTAETFGVSSDQQQGALLGGPALGPSGMLACAWGVAGIGGQLGSDGLQGAGSWQGPGVAAAPGSGLVLSLFDQQAHAMPAAGLFAGVDRHAALYQLLQEVQDLGTSNNKPHIAQLASALMQVASQMTGRAVAPVPPPAGAWPGAQAAPVGFAGAPAELSAFAGAAAGRVAPGRGEPGVVAQPAPLQAWGASVPPGQMLQLHSSTPVLAMPPGIEIPLSGGQPRASASAVAGPVQYGGDTSEPSGRVGAPAAAAPWGGTLAVGWGNGLQLHSGVGSGPGMLAAVTTAPLIPESMSMMPLAEENFADSAELMQQLSFLNSML